MMPGAEYLSPDLLRDLWDATASACAAAYAASGTDLQGFLKQLNPAWNLVGRVHFNLAENRRDAEAPFAFMATYTTRLSAQAKAQHVPLGQALREYAGAANRDKLLSLLLPVQRAARKCPWLKEMIDAGEIFHPLRWTPAEASRFLASAPELESAGVVLRMPATWRASRPARPQVTGTVGARKPSDVGLDGLLDFRMEVTLDGEALSEQEIRALLAGTDSLVLLRGQWVEVDRERLERTMRQFQEAEELAARDGLSFAEAMRMLSGAALTDGAAEAASPRLGAGIRRSLAGGNAARACAPRTAPASIPARRCAARCAPISGRRAVAASAVGPGARRLPGGRHGAGQDHPGAVAAAAGAAAQQGRGRHAQPAGGAGLAAGQLVGGNREVRAGTERADRAPLGDDRGGAEGVSPRKMRPAWTWRSPATARCCASPRWRRRSGASPFWTRRRRSRTPARSRPGRPRR